VARQARDALAARQWSKAHDALARLERIRPPIAADRLLRAEMLAGRDRPGDALRELARIDDHDPLAATARARAGRLERERGRAPAAERLLLRALELDPKLSLARRDLIYIYSNQLRHADLDRQFRALARREALTAEELFVWSMSRFVTSDSGVVDNLERFLRADPNDRASRLTLAEAYRFMGRLSEAEGLLAQLPEDDPEARALRARIAMDGNRYAFARALLAPGPAEHASLARIRGLLALHDHQFAAAASSFRTAVRLDPGDREAASGLYQALRLSGDAAGAAPHLARTNELDGVGNLLKELRTSRGPILKTFPRRIAAACERAGRPAEARAWYVLAVKEDPLDSEAQQAVFRLGRNGTISGE
jgi:tetratricopeptide (TPR) repeat protein